VNMKELSRIFVIIGGILGLIYGIISVLGAVASGLAWLVFLPAPFTIPGLELVWGIVLIILSLIALATSGVVSISMLKMDNNWIILIIIGILMYVFGGGLAAILVIIGAILLLLK
jgi:hypothetical protein